MTDLEIVKAMIEAGNVYAAELLTLLLTALVGSAPYWAVPTAAAATAAGVGGQAAAQSGTAANAAAAGEATGTGDPSSDLAETIVQAVQYAQADGTVGPEQPISSESPISSDPEIPRPNDYLSHKDTAWGWDVGSQGANVEPPPIDKGPYADSGVQYDMPLGMQQPSATQDPTPPDPDPDAKGTSLGDKAKNVASAAKTIGDFLGGGGAQAPQGLAPARNPVASARPTGGMSAGFRHSDRLPNLPQDYNVAGPLLVTPTQIAQALSARTALGVPTTGARLLR